MSIKCVNTMRVFFIGGLVGLAGLFAGCEVKSEYSTLVQSSSNVPGNEPLPPGNGNPTIPPSTCDSISSAIALKQSSNPVIVNSVTALQTAIQNAAPNSTILIADGTYSMTQGLSIGKSNVILRSQSGDPRRVILDAGYQPFGIGVGAITVRDQGAGSVIADITIQRSIYHLIHLQNADGVKIHNVILKNGGQQFVKSSPASGQSTHDVSITCSRFEMDATGRKYVWGYGTSTGSTKCYTGGIDSHGSHRWKINWNTFEGIYCDDTTAHPQHGLYTSDRGTSELFFGGLAEAAVHIWNGADHLIDGNKIINCGRGISLGLGYNPVMVTRAVVQNNMIYNSGTAKGASAEDVAIALESVSETRIAQNTIWLTNYPRAIEYRFPTSINNTIENNVTNKAITNRDNAGTTILQGNNTNATSSWY